MPEEVDARVDAEVDAVASPRPRLRGVSHQVAFFVSLVLGPVLVVLRRASLRPGDMTVVLGLNALVMLLVRGNLPSLWPLLAYAIVAGIVGDVLLLRLRPAVTRAHAIRIFAAAVPTVFTTGYFLTALGFPGGVWWALPDVTGTIVLTGILGVLLSYLAFPGDR